MTGLRRGAALRHPPSQLPHQHRQPLPACARQVAPGHRLGYRRWFGHGASPPSAPTPAGPPRRHRALNQTRLPLQRFLVGGMVLIAKRLEAGQFRWPAIRDGVIRLTPAQLSALVEGLDWTRVRGVRVPRPTSAG
ncbi:IS66 family insertion sequence element accessory protein TnpB [Azospirillum brasilense]|uniref:IS66 family insertion sequence element accessory protein TnpB n=1 Tax=Pseudomonas aeruginosa TaxID=287 RepID=UPI0016455E5F